MNGCNSAGCRVVNHKDGIRKINHIEKTGPRLLLNGIEYQDCMPLMLPADSNVFEPWDGVDPEAIKALTLCGVDGTGWVQPCSAGVLLKGCVNARAVCWPEAMTEQQVKYAIACSTCCIIFEFDDNGCDEPIKPDVVKTQTKGEVEPSPELRMGG